MAKLITFKTPAMHKGKLITEDRQGYVAKLYIGNIQEKLVLQVARHSDEVESLVHYASGQKIGDLNPIKIRHMMSFGSYSRCTDRQAAQELISDVVAKIGADKMRSVINAAPVLNT